MLPEEKSISHGLFPVASDKGSRDYCSQGKVKVFFPAIADQG